MKVKYLNVFILLVSMLASTFIFSKDKIDFTKADIFKEDATTYAEFLENLTFSVLLDNKGFAKGEDFKIKYDLKNPEYKKLLEEYKIKDIAGTGSSFEKLARVMDHFAYRLTHYGQFEANMKNIKEFKDKKDSEIKAYDLLKYSLDNKDHGISCTYKSEILKEIGLALGIYTRIVGLKPYGINIDRTGDSHYVNEIWDEYLNKWIMLDMTSNIYWVDSKGTPLSILELRDKLISEEKGLKAVWGSHPISGLDLKSRYKDPKRYDMEYEAAQFFFKVYYLKNLYLMIYEATNSAGYVKGRYYLVPDNSSYKKRVSKYLIKRSSIEASPVDR